MLFSLIGIGVFTYGVIFTLLSLLSDCDLQLLFYEKFGKSPRRLKGKVVFITGASSGIGEHIAYALAKCGVRLVLAARRNEELQRVKRNCIDSSKGLLEDRDVLVIQMDVTDTASHRKHFQHAVLHFGRVDILVNNAGRSQRAMWATTEMSVDRQLFDLNVFGVVSLTRVALEHFDKVGCGHVAVVSSLAGILPVPYSGTYTASKHAIHGYFNSLRTERLGKNIHVTLLCPGPTFSNFLAECFTEKEGEKYNGSVQPSDKRMTAERCGYLSAVALANKTSESWIAVFPLISFTYIAVYFPIVFNIALRLLGPETLFKLRDSKDLDEMKRKD
ncbi:dehydrogenase/reductase SDR family member 7 isoform X2 [Leptinotarsa decemlineata]|uniref:dehydrogenase/reductase SDR family member 7 isoform X2 n=1 Tax=Leptinotarsa decemlineata TaxID=7539 RepID=UPI003D30C9C9